jgi:hypothetical protein
LKKLNIERTVINPGNDKRMKDFYKGWKEAIEPGTTGAEVLEGNF